MKFAGGVLGLITLPALRAVSLQVEGLEPDVFSEVIAARWPSLERFELWDQGDAVELEPLLHVLSSVPLTHLSLPFTAQAEPLLRQLLRTPLLGRLRVLELHDAPMPPSALAFLKANVDAFRHLERLDLTGGVSVHEEDAVLALGDFIVLRPPADTRPLEEIHRPDWEDEDAQGPEATADPEAPNADLDIPDEHGD